MGLALQPLSIGNIELKNRLLLAPSGTGTGDGDGHITEDTLRWFEQRSKGFAIAVTEHAAVDALGVYHKNMITAADGSCIPGFSRLAGVLHQNGCRCLLQLDHGGGWDLQALRGCLDPEKNPDGHSPADELDDCVLDGIVESFGKAARRAEQAGYDGVQIKGCHVFLLGMLFSPLTNHRQAGRYSGQTFEGRSRMILETMRCIRASVGKDFIVSARIAVQDYFPGGSTVEEAARLAQELELAGADLIDLSGGVKYYYSNPYSTAPGYFGESAGWIRSTLKKPVVLTGGVSSLEQADILLQEGKGDIIGICRAVREKETWLQEALEKQQGI